MLNLGKYLHTLRMSKGYSLREVKRLSGKKVSHIYLYRLESDNVPNPSPGKLKVLSEVYGSSYKEILKVAGYLDQCEDRGSYVIGGLTEKEFTELSGYLGYLRWRNK